MPELRTINSMPNIPLCSSVVVLPTKDVTPITNYCLVIKSIKNIKTNSIGIKSLSGTCDVKVSDKLGEILNIQNISCDPVVGVSGQYTNYH
jgi:hypothetical protein